jgi:hypothetical protein
MALADSKQYDGSLHMYVEAARSPDMRRLRFLRWLMEHDRLGRPAAGPASGELTAEPVDEGDRPPFRC